MIETIEPASLHMGGSPIELPNSNILSRGVTTALLPELPVLPAGAPDAPAGDRSASGATTPIPAAATAARRCGRFERSGFDLDVVMVVLLAHAISGSTSFGCSPCSH